MKVYLIKIWSAIEKNRFSVILPTIGIILWAYAGISCTAVTQSPRDPNRQVNALELQREYEVVKAERLIEDKKYEWSSDDIATQQESYNKAQDAILKIASGSVTSWGGLIQILLSSGLMGFFADNIRKNGVIAGLKRNK